MHWDKGYLYVPQYGCAPSNQHGDRYKRTASKRLSIACLQCRLADSDGFSQLVLLSHTLDVPVRYDFDKAQTYIEVVSNEASQDIIGGS